jgi:TRAP-type C4-dicarboxylate transport system substrate-binding protein/citrate lyase beta subunit
MRESRLASNRRAFLKTLAAASAALLAPGPVRSAAAQTGTKGAKVILKVAWNQAGDENSVNWGWRRFGAAVERRLPGAVDFQFYPPASSAATRTSSRTCASALQMAASARSRTSLPDGRADVAYLFASYEQAERYLSSDAYADLMMSCPRRASRISQGLVVVRGVSSPTAGGRCDSGRRQGVEDPSPSAAGHLKSWQAFGANATPMDSPEVYTAPRPASRRPENPGDHPEQQALRGSEVPVGDATSLWAPPPSRARSGGTAFRRTFNLGSRPRCSVAPARKFLADHDTDYLKQLGQKGMAVNDVTRTHSPGGAREKIWPQFEKQHGKDMQAIVSMTRWMALSRSLFVPAHVGKMLDKALGPALDATILTSRTPPPAQKGAARTARGYVGQRRVSVVRINPHELRVVHDRLRRRGPAAVVTLVPASFSKVETAEDLEAVDEAWPRRSAAGLAEATSVLLHRREARGVLEAPGTLGRACAGPTGCARRRDFTRDMVSSGAATSESFTARSMTSWPARVRSPGAIDSVLVDFNDPEGPGGQRAWPQLGFRGKL